MKKEIKPPRHPHQDGDEEKNLAQLAGELGLDPEAALQMGTTEVECRNAMSSAAAAQLRCATSGGAVPPPATRYLTQLER